MSHVRCLLFLFSVSFFFSASLIGQEKKATPFQRIDQLIDAKLKEEGIEPNKRTTDATFVRRIYLDLVGRVPTREETLSFIQSKEPVKRAKLIRSLIGSDGYVSHQYNYWADLLRMKGAISGNNQSIPSGMAYEFWLKESLRSNKPYDEMVYEMVTATGNSWDNPAVGYYLRDYGMSLDNTAMTTQVFMGTQIVCAQCHDHPFADWTQMDYYHLAALTYGAVTTNGRDVARQAINKYEAKRKNISQERKQVLRRAASEILIPVRFSRVDDTQRGLRLPHDYQYDDAKPKSLVKPATLMGNEAVLSEGHSKLEAFGEWLTSSENPRFTKVMANRLWKEAFGVGLIEPVDDLKDHTKASNPELMEYLEKLFVRLDYDIQAFQRVIYNTRAYQREASLEEPVPGAPYHFQGPILRRMSAEQIWDSLVAMTVQNPDAPSEGRALFAKRRLATTQLVAEAVYDQTPQQFMKNILEVAAIQGELSMEIDAALEKVTEARLTDDPALIKEATDAARDIRRKLARKIEEVVYREGLEQKLKQLETPNREVVMTASADEDLLNELASAVLDEQASVGEGMDAILKDGEGVIEQLVVAMFRDEQAALNEKRKKRVAVMEKEWGVSSKLDKKSFATFTKTIERRMQRASEIGSPAPTGHFLREFGQSDRELIENASDGAAVTQALSLLNGPALASLTNKYSVLARDLAGKKFGERLNAIYLTMLSRFPTPEERKIYQQAWEADPESGTVQGIIWTVLNTRQFLFVE